MREKEGKVVVARRETGTVIPRGVAPRHHHLVVTVLLTFAVLLGSVGVLMGSALAASDWHIRDDATGGDCTRFGTWDWPAKTCTLTTDVVGRVFLDAAGLTLDGNSHQIDQGSRPYYDACTVFENAYVLCTIYANGRSGLTVKNVVFVQGHGAWLENSPDSRILNNTFGSPGHMIHLYRSSRSIVEGNVLSPGTGGCGMIYLQESQNLRVADNVVSCPPPSRQLSIDIFWGGGSVVSGNVANGGIQLRYSPGSSVDGNSVTANNQWTHAASAISIEDSNGVIITGNNARSSNEDGSCNGASCWGISLLRSSDATITGNTALGKATGGNYYGQGLLLVDSPRATITANTITGTGPWGGSGITLTRSGSSTLSGNAVSSSSWRDVSVLTDSSPSNLISDNVITSSGNGIKLYSAWEPQALNTVVRNNTVTGGSRGIGVYGGGNLVTGNSVQVWGVAIDVSSSGTRDTGRNTVEKNTIAGGSTGVVVMGSGSNTVRENKITGASTGIRLEGFLGTMRNTVQDNVVASGYVGIDLVSAYYQTIRGNRFQQNSIGAKGTGAWNSLFYNCFDNNVQQISPYGAPYNTWNDGAGKGNWWSDWIPGMHLPHWGVDWYPLSEKMCAGNTPPAVLSFTATTVKENTATEFTVLAADSENNPLTYSWDLDGDGTYESSGPTNVATRTWGDDHQGVALVRVSDGELTDEATAAVTVANTNPQVTSSDGPAVEGSPLEVSFHITDPGSDDILVKLEWGDGVTNEESYLLGQTPDPPESTDSNPRDLSGSFTRTFGDDVTLTGTLTVSDDDGGKDTRTIILIVKNGEPKIVVPPALSGFEGAPVGYSSTATDPGSDDLTFCWAWDDGSDGCQTYLNGGGTFPFTATDSGTHVWGDDGVYDTTLTVTDDDGGSTDWAQDTTIWNVAPTPSLQTDAPSYFEGSLVSAFAGFMEPGTDDVTLMWQWAGGPTKETMFYNNGATPDPSKSPWGTYPFHDEDAMAHVYDDNGLFPITVEACDDDDGCASATTSVLVENVPPTVTLVGPSPGSLYAVGELVSLIGTFTDPGTLDLHFAYWQIDNAELIAGTVSESGGSGTVADTYTFDAAGIYKLRLIVADYDGGVGSDDTVGEFEAFVVVYDPNGGFVTGGGWINSPPGAYSQDSTLTGKATFGFVAKYKKGATVPEGQTEFQFKVAGLNFHSTSYDWLVCGGPKCQFKGHGTVNGAGDYAFLLSAIDGQLPGGGGTDKLRMKIWNIMTGEVIYDNQPGEYDYADPTTVIGGGSIVIHKG